MAKEQFTPKNFEEKWRKMWEEHKIYETNQSHSSPVTSDPFGRRGNEGEGQFKDTSTSLSMTPSTTNNYYCLDMFPYPSGSGLHVGHPHGYLGSDVVSRYKRAKGFNVLHPMGFDAFGLPAENYAIKSGVPPQKTTDDAIETFKKQIEKIGLSYDWSKELATHRPDYYKWTQWLFLHLYKLGLAYKRNAPVNWCPKDQTVLANEQVIKKLKVTNYKLQVTNDTYFSYLMGAGQITDGDLTALDIKIIERKENDRSLEIPADKIEEYKKLIREKMNPGFWNEYIGDEIYFIFKHKDGKLEEFTLNSESEKAVAENATNFANEPSFKTRPVADWLFENSLYKNHTDIKTAYLEALKHEEKVEVGVCERCDSEVIQKDMEQWFFKITDYAERLIEGLDRIDWPESTKAGQRNWIGKSEGAIIKFKVESGQLKENITDIEVFTTRADTLYSAAFIVIAPESKIIENLKSQIENWDEVSKYIEQSRGKTELERQQQKEKTGVKVEGIMAVNPINNEKIPVYLGDFVIATYGTGAVFGDVHDERDFEFVKKFGIKAKPSIVPEDPMQAEKVKNLEVCFTDFGTLIDSAEFTGMKSQEARPAIVAKLEKEGKGKSKINYRLRDWLVSRQRYWGAPIPILYKELNSEEKQRQERYKQNPEAVFNFHAVESSPEKNYHPWVDSELKSKNIKTFTPQLPGANKPKIEEWVGFAENALVSNSSDNIVITGRSLGCWSALKYAEQKILRKIILVAPTSPEWIEHPGEKSKLMFQNSETFESLSTFINSAEIDFEKVNQNVAEVVVFLSKDDPYIPFTETLNYLKSKINNIRFILKDKADHFNTDSGYGTFPELINEIVKPVRLDVMPVPEADLPVLLADDVDFKPTGESPLKYSKKFHQSAVDKYGEGYTREVDTMDTFVDSSWYFFRFPDVNNQKEFADTKIMNDWCPVDLYVGGAEHTVLHLLYARFFTKALYDCEYINFDEPFQKLRHQGTILASDGRKMSKRWGNVINPDDEIEKFGADTFRVYEMFMGPFPDSKPWDVKGEIGVFRFINKVWDLQEKVLNTTHLNPPSSEEKNSPLERGEGEWLNAQQILINKLIQKVDKDINDMSFNTAVAKMMEFVNAVQKEEKIDKDVWEKFLIVLAPFAPYITEELWSRLGNSFSIHSQKWPEFDSNLVKDETVMIAVQVNGKVRDTIQISAETEQSEALELALKSDKVRKYIPTEPKKVIFVKGKILNIIA